jgi:hypothetical protein
MSFIRLQLSNNRDQAALDRKQPTSRVRARIGSHRLQYRLVLAPTQLDSAFTQFHLEVDEDLQINPFNFDYGQKAAITNLADIKSKRCYVGWCDTAHIKLGTWKLPTTIGYSKAREKERTLQLIGVSTGSHAVSASLIRAGIHGQANLSFISHHLRFEPISIYPRILQGSSRQAVLISDIQARRSWLVSKLRTTLHMAHVWIMVNDLRSTSGVGPTPFVEPHDNASIVQEAIDDLGDLAICGKGSNPPKLRSLLLGFNVNFLALIKSHARSIENERSTLRVRIHRSSHAV